MERFNLGKTYLICLFLLGSFCSFADGTAPEDPREQMRFIADILAQPVEKKKDRINPKLASKIKHIEQQTSTKKTIPYDQLYHVIHEMYLQKVYSTEKLGNFINDHVPFPSSQKVVDLNYVRIQFMEISAYRDQNRIDIANKHQKSLTKYLEMIEVHNDDYERALIYSGIHDLVLTSIQHNVKKGTASCQQMANEAKKLGDTSLYIMSQYYLCEFHVINGDLQEFIAVSEACLKLDSVRTEKSDYYIATLMHLVDAYIYEQKHPSRTLYLLNQLYEKLNTKSEAYGYLMKYLGTIPLDHPSKDSIFGLLNTSNIFDFFAKTYPACKSELYPIDFYQFIRESAHAFKNFGYVDIAMEMMELAIGEIKKIYTNDLSETIAYNEKVMLAQKKDIELKYAKQISDLYFYILICIVLLVIALLFILIRKMQQNKRLKETNKIIMEKKHEKALLMSELHHRVKNNFQIISSMLSIQAKNIEDQTMKNILRESQSRILSMSLTHEKLYENDNLEYDLIDYINTLYNYQTEIFKSKTSTLILDIPPETKIEIDMTIALGLILNELITNSLKYGMDNDGVVTIRIAVNRFPKAILMEFSDSGPGLDAMINFQETKTMGLRLVNRLTRQLQGTMQYNNKTFFFQLPTSE